MRTADRVVYLVCGAAMFVAVVAGGLTGRDDGEPLTADLEPDPSPASQEAVSHNDDAAGPLFDEAVEVGALPAGISADIMEECFRIPSEADPRLSPARSDVTKTYAARTSGAAVVVWLGSAPDAPNAFGSCVAVEDGDDWVLVGRGYGHDPGTDTSSIVWQTSAASGGTAAALTGRMSDGAAEIVLVLQDGRRFHAEVLGDGVVAIPWAPVALPARLVVLDDAGKRLYDGPLAQFS